MAVKMKSGMKMNGMKQGMKKGIYKGKETSEREKEDICPYCRKKNCEC